MPKSRSNNKKCKRGGQGLDAPESTSWFGSWFGTAKEKMASAGVNVDAAATNIVEGTKGAVSDAANAVQGVASSAATNVADALKPPPPVVSPPVVTGGGKRRKKSKTRRKVTLQVPSLTSLKMAMGVAQSRTQALAQSKARALAGGRVHAYSSSEMSAMEPAGFDSKGTSYLLGGKTRRKKSRGKKTRGKRTRGRGKRTRGRGKRGGQIW